VEGTSIYSEEEIVTYISDSLVPIGTKRAAISIAELEKALRMQYDQIAWITCDVEGTRLVVRFVETVEKEEVTTFDTPCNIVAVKDGIVLDLLAKSGTKLVNPGDEVKKGDVLITGVVNIYNEYEELIETNYVAADGIVYAQTKYQYQQAFPLDYTQKRQGKKKKTGITIQLGNSVKTLHQPKLVDGYEQVSTTHTFHIGKAYYLPFSVTVTKYYQPIYETKTYTEEEARKKQEQLLQTYIADLKKKGVEILENNVTIECKDGECLASGILVVREIIGAPETFVIPEETIQKNEE
jgi:similar to stage IV sporulation protein